PIRGEDDVKLEPLVSSGVRHRDLAGNDGELAFMYTETTSATLTRSVLKPELPFEIIAPKQELLNIWEAPFFYSDSRHDFLVTTEEQLVWVRSFPGYGIFPNAGAPQAAQIPRLVVRPVPPPKLQIWGDRGPITTDRGVVDSMPMQTLVSEDAYIRQGLPTT